MAYIQFVPWNPDETEVLSLCSVTVFLDGLPVVEGAQVGTFSEGNDQVLSLSEGSYVLWVQAPGFIFSFPISVDISDDDGGESVSDPQMIPIVAASAATAEPRPSSGLYRVWGTVEPALGSPSGSSEVAGYGARLLTVHRTHLNNYETVEIREISASTEGMFVSHTVRPRCSAEGRFEAILRPDTLYAYVRPGVRGFRYFRTGADGGDGDVEELIMDGLTLRIFGDFV